MMKYNIIFIPGFHTITFDNCKTRNTKTRNTKNITGPHSGPSHMELKITVENGRLLI